MKTDQAPSPLAGPGGSEKQQRAAVARVEHHSDEMLVQRARFFPQALIVGALVGLTAVLLRIGLEGAEEYRSGWLQKQTGSYTLLWTPIAIALIAIALVLVRWLCPEASGSGIPHLRMVLQGDFRIRWLRILPIKFLSGLAAIASGLCLGREGPTIQMGAAIGSMWADLRKQTAADRHALLVTGASAGLAAAFNAPLSGILFAVEELRINMPDSAFFAALVASITADIVTRLLLGQLPVIHVNVAKIPSLVDLPIFLLLGAVAGLASWAYNRGLVSLHRSLNFRSRWLIAVKVIAAGVAIGVAGWYDPMLVGGGTHLTYLALEGKGSIPWLARSLIIRFGLSLGSYAIGTAGGIFAPLLVLGGLLGVLVGKLCLLAIPTLPLEPTAFAAAGMAALFAGVVRCPLTGIVLMIEMTGHYELVIPLTVAAYTATFVADQLRIRPIYDALLESQLEQATAAQTRRALRPKELAK